SHRRLGIDQSLRGAFPLARMRCAAIVVQILSHYRRRHLKAAALGAHVRSDDGAAQRRRLGGETLPDPQSR
ncbi:hypothetical protein, partial [Meridianimarinicoccus zhengii]|uniref:hypothetical protein n=1 Tax=Meridianimarinicoccus zhengii TaxID=2056810 RepID=UPI001C9B81EE